MPTKKKKVVKRTFRRQKRTAFDWEDRQSDSSNKLDSEFSRTKEKDPDALEMGPGYPEGGKGLPTVKKEKSATKESCGPRGLATKKKERGMPQRRSKGMKPYGMDEFTEEDDAAMMSEMAGKDRKRGQDEDDEEEFDLEEFDLEDLDFGDLPELDEDEVEEVEECPPGCVPEVDEEEDEVEEDDDDDEEEVEEGDDEDDEEVKEGEAKEASVQQGGPDDFAFVLAADQLDSVDIQDLDFPLFDGEGENPHYLVLHRGEPVAKIALQDQAMAEEHRGPFLSDKYLRTLTGSIERVGLGEALHLSNAKIYAAQASRSEIAEEMKTAAKADMDAAFRTNVANLNDNLMNTVSLAITASVKNLILENPLKEALVHGMRKAGMSERGAVQIVEGAFHEKGTEYFQSLTNKAQEWMGMPEEAYKQVAAMVATANYAHPEDIDSGYNFEDEETLHEADALSNDGDEQTFAMPKNVPLRTVASPKQRRAGAGSMSFEDVRNDLRGRLNVRGKLTSR